MTELVLTNDEWEILYGLVEGETLEAIRKRLGVGDNRIRYASQTLRQMLGAKTLPQAVARAYHLGLLVPRRRAA